ncbi:MAG: hypothetical protein FJ312_07250 [SAR202 cluster bacterium]|nr:hypothetical protein [SAR202 cluster bacterium]
MKKDRMMMAVLFPLLAVVTVATLAFGLGGIFIALNETGAGHWGAIIIGAALVVGVPTVAFLLERMTEKRG